MLKQLLLFLKIYVHSYVVFPTKHNSNITFSYSCLFFYFTLYFVFYTEAHVSQTALLIMESYMFSIPS